MIGRLFRNLLGCNQQTFQPSRATDFKACAMAGTTFEDVCACEAPAPAIRNRQHDRDEEGATKQSGLFVRAMLQGRSLSIQQYVGLLKQEGFGKVNWPGSSAGRARRWLRARGVNVSWRWEKTRTGKKHKVWWVDPTKQSVGALYQARQAYNAKNKGQEVR